MRGSRPCKRARCSGDDEPYEPCPSSPLTRSTRNVSSADLSAPGSSSEEYSAPIWRERGGFQVPPHVPLRAAPPSPDGRGRPELARILHGPRAGRSACVVSRRPSAAALPARPWLTQAWDCAGSGQKTARALAVAVLHPSRLRYAVSGAASAQKFEAGASALLGSSRAAQGQRCDTACADALCVFPRHDRSVREAQRAPRGSAGRRARRRCSASWWRRSAQ